MTRCKHDWQPLYRPTTIQMRLDAVLKGFGDYRVCARCQRVGAYGFTGRFTLLCPEFAERRRKEADEWHAWYAARPELD